MHGVATVLGLLTLVTLVSVAARRLTLPYPTLMVVSGLAIALVPGLPHVEPTPELILLLFLPPLLYAAAWHSSWHEFRANLRPITLLAVGLVLLTMASVAIAVHWAVPTMPWEVAFALGAIVSPPDAVAAVAVTRGLSLPRRTIVILEGESLVNDATGLVAYRVAVAAAVTGAFSWSATLGHFALAAGGGIAIGYAVARLFALVHRQLDDPTVETVMTLLTPYAAYLPAEWLGASGVLATVTAGLTMTRLAPLLFSSTTRLQAGAVWEVVVFLLNGITFVFIGLGLPKIVEAIRSRPLVDLVSVTALVCITVVLVRLFWIFPAAYLPRLLIPGLAARDPMPRWQSLLVMGWAGMRGVVSLAAALALPLTTASGASFPERDLVLFLTFAVISFTLVVQSLTLPALIRVLGVSTPQHSPIEIESEARLELVTAAVMHLEQAATEDDQSLAQVERLRLHFEEEGHEALAKLTALHLDTDPSLHLDWECCDLYRGALAAQRRRLLELREVGRYDLQTIMKLERDLDLTEARLRSVHGAS